MMDMLFWGLTLLLSPFAYLWGKIKNLFEKEEDDPWIQ